MSWIVMSEGKNGVAEYWVKDQRDGAVVAIFAGNTAQAAMKVQHVYDTRKALEKDGYEDGYQEKLDKLKSDG